MDNETWEVYICNYCIQVAFITLYGPAIIVFNSLQPILITQVAIQLNYLSSLLESLSDKNETKPDIKNIQRQIYESHIKLQTFVGETARIFSVGNLFQLFLSAFMIAFAIYAIAASPYGRSMDVFCYTLAVLSELAVFCYFGQVMSDKFKEFYDNLLQVQWYRFSNDEKRNFLIILHNVQQPVVVKTFFDIELSMIMYRNVS